MNRSSGSCGKILLVILAGIAVVLFWIAYPLIFEPQVKPEDTPWPAALPLIKRGEWGIEAISNPGRVVEMKKIDKITIHHDGLPSLPMKTEENIRSRIVSIRKSHSQTYADIGYHYIVDPLGRVWEGRPVNYLGAHVQGQNANNLGILFLGNTEEVAPTPEGLTGLFILVRYLRQHYLVKKDAVFTHRELGQTACPGKYLQAEIVQARKRGEFDLPETRGPFSFQEFTRKLKEFWDKF
jgi:N-acetylmuramoyl-L-alanine amidase